MQAAVPSRITDWVVSPARPVSSAGGDDLGRADPQVPVQAGRPGARHRARGRARPGCAREQRSGPGVFAGGFPARLGQVVSQRFQASRWRDRNPRLGRQGSAGDRLERVQSRPASSADNSTTSRPPPSSGTRITMPPPSLVTSSGPSPVRGFIAAIPHPLPARGRMRPRGRPARAGIPAPAAGPATHSRVDQYLYYPEFRPTVVTISTPFRPLPSVTGVSGVTEAPRAACPEEASGDRECPLGPRWSGSHHHAEPAPGPQRAHGGTEDGTARSAAPGRSPAPGSARC